MNKYSYLKIPLDYICIYNKLAYCLYSYGIDIIKDCSASCKTNNKNIIEFWNLFQLAIVCFEKNEIDKANYFIDYIKSNLDKIYNSIKIPNYKGANNYYIDEEGNKHTCIVCNGWIYETPNFITTYEFVMSGGTTIEDDGKGQTINIQITSTKTVSDGNDIQTEDIPFDIRYNNINDANWIIYNYNNKTLTIKPNSSEPRTGNIYFEQNESNKRIDIIINQAKDTIEYEYYFEYEPKSFTFEKEGGRIQLNVTKSSKRELKDSLPVGDEISVEWNAKVDGYGFNYDVFENEVIAEANDYKARTGKLIINRPELGTSKDIEIPITQKAGELTIIYSLQAITDNSIIPALNGKVTITVLSTKQGYYGSEPIGEPEQVPFTITSARGFLSGVSENGTVWNMTDNISETTREDTLIVTQNNAEGKEVRIKIVQQPAVIDYVYTFETDSDTIRVEATEGDKTLNVISTKQKTINGKPYGDAIQINYNSSITEGFSINKNVINISENQDEEEKQGTATFIQDESKKQFTVTIIQNAATESYEYTFTVAEGTNKVSFPYTAYQKTFHITSEKQKLLNGNPSGGKVQVAFKTIIQGDGYSVGATTNNTAEIKVSENKTTNIRIGSVRFVQDESNKELPISLEQAAGTSEWRYTLEVTETVISVPNYESKGITRNFTIQSYRKLYINGVYQDQQVNVPYNVSSNQSWCKVNNNSTQIAVDENLSNYRTADVIINQTESSNSKTIKIRQNDVQKETITNIGAPSFMFEYPGQSFTKEAIVSQYTLINTHIKENVREGSVTSVRLTTGDTRFFSLRKESYNNIWASLIATPSGNPSNAYICNYDMITTLGTRYGQCVYYDNNLSIARYINKSLNFDVYLFIKENYIITYQKLITIIISNNKAIKEKPDNVVNKQIINCWNLFQSAVAAYNLGFEKDADFFINFIDCNIDKIKNIDEKLILQLNDGNLEKVINNNNEDVEFKADISTGQLIQIGEIKDNITIKDNYLIQEYGTEN